MLKATGRCLNKLSCSESYGLVATFSCMKPLLLALLLLAAAARAQPTRADTARLGRHLRYLVGQYPARNAAHPAVLDSVADYLARQLAAAGGRVARQPYQVNGRTYQNVVASFGPATGPRTVVGAHYDVCGEQPGADDNRRTAKLTAAARPPCWSWPACWGSTRPGSAWSWWPTPWKSRPTSAPRTWVATCTRPACTPPGPRCAAWWRSKCWATTTSGPAASTTRWGC